MALGHTKNFIFIDLAVSMTLLSFDSAVSTTLLSQDSAASAILIANLAPFARTFLVVQKSLPRRWVMKNQSLTISWDCPLPLYIKVYRNHKSCVIQECSVFIVFRKHSPGVDVKQVQKKNINILKEADAYVSVILNCSARTISAPFGFKVPSPTNLPPPPR